MSKDGSGDEQDHISMEFRVGDVWVLDRNLYASKEKFVVTHVDCNRRTVSLVGTDSSPGEILPNGIMLYKDKEAGDLLARNILVGFKVDNE